MIDICLKTLDSGTKPDYKQCSTVQMMKLLLRKSGYITALVLLGSYALIALRGPQGMSALMERRKQVRELQEVNATLAAENKQKREHIERLKTSKAEQELAIRDKLKLGREGEMHFIRPEPAKD
jgi:cell division protein FtsB